MAAMETVVGTALALAQLAAGAAMGSADAEAGARSAAATLPKRRVFRRVRVIGD
jgi:hypothetical protein